MTVLSLLNGCSSFLGCFRGGLFIRDISERLSISDSVFYLLIYFFSMSGCFVSDESSINGDLFTSDGLFITYGLY